MPRIRFLLFLKEDLLPNFKKMYPGHGPSTTRHHQHHIYEFERLAWDIESWDYNVRRRMTYFNRRHNVYTGKEYQQFLNARAITSHNFVSMTSIILLVLMELNRNMGNSKVFAVVPYDKFFVHTAFWTTGRRLSTQVTFECQANMTDSKPCDDGFLPPDSKPKA
jgi:hypothetical protein